MKQPEPAPSPFNLPNALTTLRLGMALALFALIDLRHWEAAFGVFIAAAFTDWLDGYVARRQGLVSPLGRIYDPLVDKVLICGTFVFLLAVHDTGLPGQAGWNAWMVAAMVAREFVVTGIRGFLEDRGVPFGADWLGKSKMVLQCAAILWVLLALALAERGGAPSGAAELRDALNVATVAVTVLSGANYVRRALAILVSETK